MAFYVTSQLKRIIRCLSRRLVLPVLLTAVSPKFPTFQICPNVPIRRAALAMTLSRQSLYFSLPPSRSLILTPLTGDSDAPGPDQSHGPHDIASIPDLLVTDLDDRVPQSEVMEKIIAASLPDFGSIDAFNDMGVRTLKLSELKRFFDDKDETVLNQLSHRHSIEIDDHFCLKPGGGHMSMATDKTTLGYHLTVANCIGFSTILPNVASSPHFVFELDMKKPYHGFKGKHAMVGFDTKGRMLYVGRTENEDVFLAMAPDTFLSNYDNDDGLCAPGHSSGSPLMSTRHYRQVISMLAYFLGLMLDHGYDAGNEPVPLTYSLDLEAAQVNWELFTNDL